MCVELSLHVSPLGLKTVQHVPCLLSSNKILHHTHQTNQRSSDLMENKNENKNLDGVLNALPDLVRSSQV